MADAAILLFYLQFRFCFQYYIISVARSGDVLNLQHRSESRRGKQVRAQLAGEAAAGGKVSVVEIARNIVKTEGPLGLYAGLSAAAARQVSFECMRISEASARLFMTQCAQNCTGVAHMF